MNHGIISCIKLLLVSFNTELLFLMLTDSFGWWGVEACLVNVCDEGSCCSPCSHDAESHCWVSRKSGSSHRGKNCSSLAHWCRGLRKVKRESPAHSPLSRYSWCSAKVWSNINKTQHWKEQTKFSKCTNFQSERPNFYKVLYHEWARLVCSAHLP